MFGMLTLAICSLLPLKANCVICSTMGSNYSVNTHGLLFNAQSHHYVL